MAGTQLNIGWLAVLVGMVLTLVVFPGTFVRRGPTVEVAGHYVPLDAIQTSAAAGEVVIPTGSGSLADLRLTESLIPDHLGHFSIDGEEIRYRHEAAHRSALVTEPRWLTGSHDRTFAHKAVPDGSEARVLVGWSEAGRPDDALAAACTATEREGEQAGVAWARIELLDAEGLWIPDDNGALRTVLLPLSEGVSRTVGEATLAVLEDDGGLGVWILPGADRTEGCDAACLQALRGAPEAYHMSGWISSVPGALDAMLRDQPGMRDALAGNIVRVRKPRAFVRVGQGAPRPVLPGGLGLSHFTVGGHGLDVFRKADSEETTNLRVRPLAWVAEGLWDAIKAPAPLLVSNSDPDTPSVYLFDCAFLSACREKGQHCPDEEVGTTTVAEDEWFVAGSGVHYRLHLARPGERADAPRGALEVRLEVPPSGRVRLFASLAASRFKAYNRRISIPLCEEQRVVLRGQTDERVLPEGVDASSVRYVRGAAETIETLPLPAWVARTHDLVRTEGRTAVDIGTLCVEDDQLRYTDLLAGHGIGASSATVASGDTFSAAGHTLRYTAAQPMLEQVVPLLSFIGAVWFGSMAILVRIRRTIGVGTTAAGVVVASVAVLMAVGGVLQVRMGASDSLLGSPDYVHRHLITGWFAIIVLVCTVEATAWTVKQDGWDRCARVLRAAAVGVLALAGAAAVDWMLWAWLGPPDEQIMTNDAVWRGVARFQGLLWSLGLGLAAAALLVRIYMRRPAPERSRGPFVAVADWWDSVRDRLANTSSGSRLRAARKQDFADFVPLRSVSGAVLAMVVWLMVRTWDFLVDRPTGDDEIRRGFGVGWLFVAAVVMVLGAALAVIKPDSRSLLGFDLKPSEFTPLLLGLGFGSTLAAFRTEGASHWWWVPLRIAVYVALLEALLIVFYGIRADLGPLMVMLPSVLALLFLWSFSWAPGDARVSPLRTARDFGISLTFAGATLGGGVVVLRMLHRWQGTFTELPVVGSSFGRGIDRLGTWTDAWYTVPGWWTTRAHWIAARYYGDAREVYLSNLHSDLAYTALIQSFGAFRALLVLGLFAALVGGLIWFGEVLVSTAGRLDQAVDTVNRREGESQARAIPAVRLASRWARWNASIGYLAYFAAAYIGMEVLVHVGTCFNTTLQTGITLPWVSSGGSAAVGFALLVGAALGLGATGLGHAPPRMMDDAALADELLKKDASGAS